MGVALYTDVDYMTSFLMAVLARMDDRMSLTLHNIYLSDRYLLTFAVDFDFVAGSYNTTYDNRPQTNDNNNVLAYMLWGMCAQTSVW